jgi:hypothetical protein
MSLKISSYTETKKPLRQGKGLLLSKATTGFEPVMEVLQTSALPLGHVARNKSGRRIACRLLNKAGEEIRTLDLLLGKETFYH